MALPDLPLVISRQLISPFVNVRVAGLPCSLLVQYRGKECLHSMNIVYSGSLGIEGFEFRFGGWSFFSSGLRAFQLCVQGSWSSGVCFGV